MAEHNPCKFLITLLEYYSDILRFRAALLLSLGVYSMVLGTIGAIASLAGPVLGAFGESKSKGKASTAQSGSGFESYSPEIQKYLEEDIFPRIQEYSGKGYQSLPMRRAMAADYDPIFGSRVIQYMQPNYDYQAQQAQAEPAFERRASQDALDALRNEMIARQYIGGLDPSKKENWRTLTNFNAGLMDQKNLEQIGAYRQALQAAGGSPGVARQQNPEAFAGYEQAINIDPRVRAYQLKGLL